MVGHGDDVVRSRAEIRPGARAPLIILDPLAGYLREAGIDCPALTAEPIGDGHSNPTYLLQGAEPPLVVRRPPRPPLPPSAHDVLREARLLRALEPTPARCPRVVAICDDADIIGAPFYVMERIVGEVVSDTVPTAFAAPGDRRAMGFELIDSLVELHGIDWRAAGLERFGRPDGYLGRQIKLFRHLWDVNKTRELDQVEEVANWLSRNEPESGPATIVHGDYRLGNVMFSRSSPPRLNAIFDWETATIGDPLADVGYLCAIWVESDDPPAMLQDHVSGATRMPGFPSRTELVGRYEERSGRSLAELRWYWTLALWKAIVFMEGNYRRALEGATDDPYLRGFGGGVVELAESAAAMAFPGDAHSLTNRSGANLL
jgi:aminoglycoside phosphotransferase (APT) family kinase protein